MYDHEHTYTYKYNHMYEYNTTIRTHLNKVPRESLRALSQHQELEGLLNAIY